MKAPKTVKLGPYNIEVRYDRQAMAAASTTGAYLADLSTVLLGDNNSADVERDSLLHELLHAIWKQSGLHLEYPDDETDSKGEAMIQLLAPRLLELLRRNPTLVRYLTSD